MLRRPAMQKRRQDDGDIQLCPLESYQHGCTGSKETVPTTLLDDHDCRASAPEKCTFCLTARAHFKAGGPLGRAPAHCDTFRGWMLWETACWRTHEIMQQKPRFKGFVARPSRNTSCISCRYRKDKARCVRRAARFLAAPAAAAGRERSHGVG
jgi:hypothetical protein